MCYEERYIRSWWRPRQELPPRKTRFTTDSILVTGNSVEELEAAAIAQGVILTGRPAEVLDITNSYTVHQIPAEGVPPRNLVAEAVEARYQARDTGHTLWATMYVCEYAPDPAGIAGAVFVPSEQVREELAELEWMPEGS